MKPTSSLFRGFDSSPRKTLPVLLPLSRRSPCPSRLSLKDRLSLPEELEIFGDIGDIRLLKRGDLLGW